MASLAWATPTSLATTRAGHVTTVSRGELGKAQAPAAKAAFPESLLTGSGPALAASLLTTAAAFGGSRSRRRLRAAHLETGRIVSLPQETYEEWTQKARELQSQSWSKTFYDSFMGGCYVGMAALLSLVMGGNLTANPLAQTMIYAALFPVNLLLVLQTNSQLFTGNAAIMAIGAYEGQVTLKGLLRNWTLTYLGNLLGCLTLSVVAQYTGMLTGGTAAMAIRVVMAKCSTGFGQAMVKGIMCNWLLCLAMWLGTMARGLTGKMIGVWFPISMFVGIGFEHSITNMFMLPSGIAAGAPSALSAVVMNNLIPVTLGNALAGALIVGAGMSYAFGSLGQTRRRLVLKPKMKDLGSLVTN